MDLPPIRSGHDEPSDQYNQEPQSHLQEQFRALLYRVVDHISKAVNDLWEEYEGRMTRSRTSARPVMNRHNSATSTLVSDGFVCRSVRTYLKLDTKYPEFKSLMNEIALATNKTLPREILRDFFVKYQFSYPFKNLHS